MTATSHRDTILLVDDDPPIRRLIRRSLESQEHQLLEACNGDEALRLAAAHHGPIDLLVTDVVMPRMDGFTLGECLVESHPEIHVLFLSGQADRSTAVRGGLREAGQSFLLKPFTRDCLLRAIRDQLRAEPARRPAAERAPATDSATAD
jgi:two-component system cell cycle sensor histidine kinase/response regulator CckA